MSGTPPLSLYVHLPWCVRKCPYCDFNSHTAGASPPRARYVDALVADIHREAELVPGRELVSVFLGGGTPSLFKPGEIARILDAVRTSFDVADDAEITMEANPGTVESGAPAGYRAAGVNRLSIGAQSFAAAQLEILGRIHTPGDIGRAVDEARKAGFDNLNVDIMFALPGQGVADALADLEQATALAPEHISWYQLTLEPNTVFFARPPEGLPDDALAVEIQEHGQALLADHGFDQYEVSAYARDGRRCRHNLNYWLFGDYLAIGAGAHGKLTRSADVYRYVKPAHPLAYMQFVESGEQQPLGNPLDEDNRLFEFLLNALRLTHGFDEKDFAERALQAPNRLAGKASVAIERGLIKRDSAGVWRPTGLGQRFLDDLTEGFLP